MRVDSGHDLMEPSNAICLTKAVQALAAHAAAPQPAYGVQANNSRAWDKAWAILLDLGSNSVQGHNDDGVIDEQLAVARACSELAQQHRTAEAAELQQLAQTWLSSTQYMARLAGGSAAAAELLECSSNSSTRFVAMPLSEQRAMLSLLLALRGSCPAAAPVLTTLPALGSDLLKGLQQEAQAAAAAAGMAGGCGSSNSSWVPMSAELEALLAARAPGGKSNTNTVQTSLKSHAPGSSSSCTQQHPAAQAGAQAGACNQAASAEQQQMGAAVPATAAPAGAGLSSISWVSPAAAAMQLLQKVPLNAAAMSSANGPSQWRQQQQGGVGSSDALLLAGACEASQQQLGAAVGPPPLLQCVTQQMQLASLQPSTSKPLGTSISSGDRLAAGSKGRGGSKNHVARNIDKHDAALKDAAISAPAADAAAAVKAAADVKPWLGSLMQLSSGEPGTLSTALLGKKPDSSSGGGGGGGMSSDATDTAPQQDVLGRSKTPLQPGQQQGGDRWCLAAARPANHSSNSNSSSSGSSVVSSARQEEGALVSIACLALQGVWSAVQQLWDLVLQEPVGAGGLAAGRRSMGLCGAAVQQRLLVQVLHIAELRLRLKAFVLHFQRNSFSNPSTDSNTDTSVSCPSLQGGLSTGSAASSNGLTGVQGLRGPGSAVSVQRAFLDAVAQVLSEHDASLAAGQVQKLLQQQRSQGPGTASLLQLLTTQRGMSRQLQQLAEVCCCTVQAFVDKRLFLQHRDEAESVYSRQQDKWQEVSADTSSMLNFHALQAVRGGQRARRAAAEGFRSAAADAYTQRALLSALQCALPWPGQAQMEAALQLGWAPSSWQMARGFEGGDVLLERLYAGVLQASPEAAPLLQHLLAAAMQPMQQSLRSWALLPDTSAAEAAAEATAMCSFTAGAGSMHRDSALQDSAITVEAAAAAAAAPGSAGLLYGSFAGASSSSSSARDTTATTRQWSGSRAAEAAITQGLQQAWEGICQRTPGCPAFLAFLQQPAAVAGAQLQLLQLLGGHGRALAERVGWLAGLEQQELLEAVAAAAPAAAAGAAGGARAAGAVAGTAGAVPSAGLSKGVAPSLLAHAGLLQGPQQQQAFMGLVGSGSSSSMLEGTSGQGAWGASPPCNLTAQQLAQCAAIIADYEAARHAEVQKLLLSLAEQRAANAATHELWLFDRQLERQQAEAAHTRLQEEAAARRRLRQRMLLAQQQEEVASAQARRAGARVAELAHERALLQQAALQEHQEALQQLKGELVLLSGGTTLTAAATGAATGAATDAAADAISAAGSALAAAASSAAAHEEVLDIDSISLQLPEAEPAPAARAAPAAAPAAIPKLNLLAALGQDQGRSGAIEGPHPTSSTFQQQQSHQPQQKRQRETWGPPLQNIGPAAGAPSGQQASGPLAVVGTAAAVVGAGAAAMQQQAAGRRSNSQPKLLAGMGRPLSLSRRNSSCEGAAGSTSGGSVPVAADPPSGIAAVGGAAAVGVGAARGSPSSAVSGVGSILGGMALPAGTAAAGDSWGQQQQQQAAHARSKWGPPVMPGPAAGVASQLQRSASTGNILEHHSSTNHSHQQQQQQRGLQQVQNTHPQQLQRRPSGNLGLSSGSSTGGPSSRPSTPRGRRFSEHAGWEAAAGAQGPQPHQHLTLQQSWHHQRMHQQQQQLLLMEPAAASASASGSVGIRAGSSGGSSGAAVAGPAAAAAVGGGSNGSTGYLLSRHQQQSENQGNGMILSWLLQQNGLGSAPASWPPHSAAAGPAIFAAAPTAVADEDAEQQAAGHPQKELSSGASAGAAPAVSLAPVAAAAGAATAGAGPIVAALNVLLVQPIMTQQRLTTQACWTLLLQEHKLLQGLGAVQGLFFQQQGDWVMLLCESLEPLLQRQQQQLQNPAQQQGLPGAVGAAAAAAGGAAGRGEAAGGSGCSAQLSPVVLQLLLESAVQQSCLAGAPEAERLSLQAVRGRTLAGWSSARSTSRHSTTPAAAAAQAAAAAGDCLQLGYKAPWPLSLLLSDERLTQYAEVFSVLLRLRRLQQQLVKQWKHLNHRAGGGSSSRAAGATQRQGATQQGTQGYRRSGSSSIGAAGRRGTWSEGGRAAGAVAAAAAREAAASGGGNGSDGAAAGRQVPEGVSRLQQLRRWHALALHCVDSLLGYMLGELSGRLQAEFDSAVGNSPVSLPVMLEAHAQLLAAARHVCGLPPLQQQQQGGQQGGAAAGEGVMGIAGVVYAIMEAAWQLQQQVAQLLGALLKEEGGAAGGSAGGSNGPVGGSSSSSGGMAAGLREGHECMGLANALDAPAGGVWESALEPAGLQLEHLIEVLKRHLRRSSSSSSSGVSTAASVGQHLGARLGV